MKVSQKEQVELIYGQHEAERLDLEEQMFDLETKQKALEMQIPQ